MSTKLFCFEEIYRFVRYPTRTEPRIFRQLESQNVKLLQSYCPKILLHTAVTEANGS